MASRTRGYTWTKEFQIECLARWCAKRDEETRIIHEKKVGKESLDLFRSVMLANMDRSQRIDYLTEFAKKNGRDAADSLYAKAKAQFEKMRRSTSAS